MMVMSQLYSRTPMVLSAENDVAKARWHRTKSDKLPFSDKLPYRVILGANCHLIRSFAAVLVHATNRIKPGRLWSRLSPLTVISGGRRRQSSVQSVLIHPYLFKWFTMLFAPLFAPLVYTHFQEKLPGLQPIARLMCC